MPAFLRHPSVIATFLALVFVSTTRASETEFANATRLYQNGQWQPAADAFDAVAQQLDQNDPKRLEAQLYTGECLMRVGQYAQARQRYQLVRHRAPTKLLESQALFRLGEVAWLSNEINEATELLNTYIETYPDGRSLAYAQNYVKQINEQKAKKARYEVLDEAVRYEREARFDEALVAYASLLRQETVGGEVRSETLRRAARLHERLAQRDDAVALYKQFLTEFPHSKYSAQMMQAIAWNYVQSDQTAQASDQFQALLLKFPQSPQAAEAAYWLAQRSADENNTGRALELTQGVLAQPEAAKQTPSLLARVLCLHCQLIASQEAWADIESLVESNKEVVSEGPLRSVLEFWSAEAAFRARDYNTARQRFAALEPKTIGIQQPWVAMVPLRRAQLAARRQQWAELLNILDRMEREFPGFTLAYEVDYLRGRALAGRGEMTAARRYYRQVLDNPDANDSEAVSMAGWMIGETYFHQRDYPRARAAYEAVMERTTYPEWQSRAALQAGKCWELEQRWDEASRVYARALQRWPDSYSGEQLKSRLRWAQNQTRQETKTQQR
ncbi:MAG: tetratricopeptide repeat protein [Planctomycetota bacterium]